MNIEDVAVDDSSGDVYLPGGSRVVELSPYGSFLRAFGKEVDQSKVTERKEQEASLEPVTVTAEEEDVCTAASGDQCTGTGVNATTGGAFGSAISAAVDQATGDVYVADSSNHRVEKFDASGHFLLAFGKEVDKSKVEAVKAKEANGEVPTVAEVQEENVCSAASGDECEAGKTGTGEAAFESWAYKAKVLAVGGPEDLVYVGDKARVEVFKADGEYKEAISLTGISATAELTALAVDSTGDLFVVDQNVAGVHLIEPGGVLSATKFDESSSGIEAIALDGSGHLLVADRSPSFRVLEYEVASPGGTPGEFAGSEPGELTGAKGIAVDGAGTIYAANIFPGKLVFYGSLAAMEGAYGAPPSMKPTIGAESVSATADETTATLQAQINPQLRETTYQFEYGLEPCAAGGCSRVPATPESVGSALKTEHFVAAPVAIELGCIYHYRVLATSAAGIAEGQEQLFTVGTSSIAGPTGLPDGRVYEQVSPTDKHGNFFDEQQYVTFGLASADGDAVIYPMTGPVGDAGTSGLVTEFASLRTPAHGWQTVSATPRPTSEVTLVNSPLFMLPSSDYKRFVFTSTAPFVAEDPGRLNSLSGVNIFLSEDPALPPQWLGKPRIANPEPPPGQVGLNEYSIAGASNDLSTIYFTAKGTLVPEDAARQAGWGFYEWHEGDLVSAARLPDGSFSPNGAVPAGTGTGGVQASLVDNQVSEDGSRAFFVSPDPTYATDAEPAELYVHERNADGTTTSILVSASHLPGHQGEAAPDGVAAMPNAAETYFSRVTYAYPSADGSQVFFSSADRLTADAPADTALKMYEFTLASNRLTYLPNVTAPIVQVSHDGSAMLFESQAAKPPQLELWRTDGSVVPIAELSSYNPQGIAEVDESHFADADNVIVFRTPSALPGGFKNGGGYPQAYRYEVSAGSLTCISCPPGAAVPVGGAHMSYNSYEAGTGGTKYNGSDWTPATTRETRAISANGSRIFFDTPSALVPQDTNGTRDVYEWQDGKVFLISTGASTEPSLYLDSDEDGENVFFATQQGLDSGDTDEAYDVYDARIPRPGDSPQPGPAPCKGAVCQGPPSVPSLLGQPASEAFVGLGNLTQLKSPQREKSKGGRGSRSKPRNRRAKRLATCGRSRAHGSIARRAGTRSRSIHRAGARSRSIHRAGTRSRSIHRAGTRKGALGGRCRRRLKRRRRATRDGLKHAGRNQVSTGRGE